MPCKMALFFVGIENFFLVGLRHYSSNIITRTQSLPYVCMNKVASSIIAVLLQCYLFSTNSKNLLCVTL